MTNTYYEAHVEGDTEFCKQVMMQASCADTPTAATARVAIMRRGLTSIASLLVGKGNDGRVNKFTLVVLCVWFVFDH